MSGPDEPGAIVAGIRRSPPPGPLPDSDPALVARLREEIGRDGPITFARFMAVALYDPDGGYYGAPTARPGPAGDFLTAPEAHPIFGWTIARALEDAWALLDRPAAFTLVEHGAGTGTLALAILEGLRRSGSPLLARLRYEPVELVATRREELLARLAAAGVGDRVTPADPATAPTPAPVTGVVLANELLDALPVHRVTVADGRLRELLVGWDGSGFVDVPADPTTPALAARLADEGVVLAEGQRAEICLALDDWVAGVARRLDRGLVLVVDYGHEAPELYGPTRREGTLRTYLRHMAGADPYVHVGRQDLTAHVDLTALRRAAERHGLRHLGTASQAHFLLGSGVEGLLAAVRDDPATGLGEYAALRSALMRLLDPAATGGFRVVVLGRGVPDDATLPGLAWRPPDPRAP